MNKVQIARVRKEATINTYGHLWHASWAFLYRAENTVEGSYYQIMAGLLFAALALEAFCNHVGSELIDCWGEIEKKLGPHEKLSLICERLKLAKDPSKRPYQTVNDLIKFRNAISHGKSVVLDKEFLIPMDEHYEKFLQEELEAEWQKFIQVENLKRIRTDVKEIITSIHKAAKLDDYPFNVGFWGYQAGAADVESLPPNPALTRPRKSGR